jgi:signal peptidase I
MVNTLLVIVAAVTLLVWLVQELIARRAREKQVIETLQHGATLTAEAIAAEPIWSDWAFKLVVALWFGWLAAAVLIKDGDFAFVLVILTLLCGVIAGLDRFWFARRRQAFIEAKPIVTFLNRFSGEQAEETRVHAVTERTIAEYGRSFFPVLAAVLVLRSFVVEPFQIPSSSMVPTLEVGDYILVNKFSYGLRLPVLKTKILNIGQPQRGDVIVFFPPNDNRYFIKRLIGLPGDHIEYHNKVLTINGERADQTLLAALPPSHPILELAEEKLGPVTHQIHKDLRIDRGDFSAVVEPGHYFMMGDNRDNSSDSRYWGQAPEENIVGKAFAVWMHWESLRDIPSFDRGGKIR